MRKRAERFDYSNQNSFAQRSGPRSNRAKNQQADMAKVPVLFCQAAKLFTNSTRLRRAIPDGPLAIQGFWSSVQAVPAISR